MPKKKKQQSIPESPLSPEEAMREAIIVGHYIKYNLYLMAKATIFASIYSNYKSTRDALAETRAIMREFDRPPSPRKKLKDE